MPLPDTTLAVVGADFPNSRGPTRRFEIAICRPGELVELKREPKNVADRNAIAVYSVRGIQIGYLAAERAPLIGQLLRRDNVIAVFQEQTSFGALIRVAFDGVPPDLPPRNFCSEPEPDFWPDEEYPDE